MAINRGKSFWRFQIKGVRAWINIGLPLFCMALIVASLTMRQEFGGELSLNLAAETAGVWVAVVLIGEVLRRDQEKHTSPARAVALWRIREIYHNISRFWMTLAFHGIIVDGMQQLILDENDMQLFDERLAGVINETVLSSSDASEFDGKSTSAFVSDWASAIQRDIELVTQGYGQYLSPEMLYALSDVENNDFIAGLADDLDQRLHEKESLHKFAKQGFHPQMWRVIGTNWYEKFIPAIKGLGGLIAKEIAAMPDAGDAFDGSIGRQFPKLAGFDPECKDILEDIRFLLNAKLNKSSQDTEASDD